MELALRRGEAYLLKKNNRVFCSDGARKEETGLSEFGHFTAWSEVSKISSPPIYHLGFQAEMIGNSKSCCFAEKFLEKITKKIRIILHNLETHKIMSKSSRGSK